MREKIKTLRLTLRVASVHFGTPFSPSMMGAKMRPPPKAAAYRSLTAALRCAVHRWATSPRLIGGMRNEYINYNAVRRDSGHVPSQV